VKLKKKIQKEYQKINMMQKKKSVDQEEEKKRLEEKNKNGHQENTPEDKEHSHQEDLDTKPKIQSTNIIPDKKEDEDFDSQFNAISKPKEIKQHTEPKVDATNIHEKVDDSNSKLNKIEIENTNPTLKDKEIEIQENGKELHHESKEGDKIDNEKKENTENHAKEESIEEKKRLEERNKDQEDFNSKSKEIIQQNPQTNTDPKVDAVINTNEKK